MTARVGTGKTGLQQYSSQRDSDMTSWHVQAVAHVQTLGGSEAARLQYDRIKAARNAAVSQPAQPATKVSSKVSA